MLRQALHLGGPHRERRRLIRWAAGAAHTATKRALLANDPHLEWGLAQALAAQGKDDSVPRAAYRAHWKGTRDLTLDDLG